MSELYTWVEQIFNTFKKADLKGEKMINKRDFLKADIENEEKRIEMMVGLIREHKKKITKIKRKIRILKKKMGLK